ncbi:GntR family transcriptional regulator [Nonomuraea sp. NPDC049158]|uniref:GntR family transcriptional regulator n=1 Tax=Nonomuraea sp. NPDC049158 TaxID=3155649 RepID=UPI00340A3D16
MEQDSSIAQITAILRQELSRLRPGDRLPSSRELMRRHNVSPVTVSRAIGQLAAEGRVVTKPGIGAFIAQLPARPNEPPDFSWQTVALGDRVVDESPVTALLTPPPEGVIPLTGGYLNPDLRPDKQLAAAAGRAVRRPGAWAMPPLSGLAELRRWFATQAGGDVTAADALIVSGGQAALTHAFRALAAPGTPVLVETPTTRAPWPRPGRRACGRRPCRWTGTAYGPICWPRRSPSPARGCSSASPPCRIRPAPPSPTSAGNRCSRWPEQRARS